VLASAIDRVNALPDDHLVLDVGGWAAPLERADWVLDLLPYETRGLYGRTDPARERFTAATWVQRDICAAEPWPFADRQFDFAVCSHTLEDVRDPIRVCQELARVAKAGYVEVPAAVEELTWGVHGPWVGWSHHHWITELRDDGLVFSLKPHLLGAPDRHLPQGSVDQLAPQQRVLQLWWDGTLPVREQILVDAGEFDGWLAGLLEDARASAGPAASARPRTFLRARRR